MSDLQDSGDGFWGRTEEREFSYVVTVPSSGENVSLTAVQDRDICAGTPEFPSHGHCVWDAALLLADYLQSKAKDEEGEGRSDFQDKKVVTLGAGVGLVGMALAVLGARVILTDQEYALPLLNKNVASGGSLAAWVKDTDVVVFSDVLYNAAASILLIQTLHQLVSPTTDVIFSFETRNAAIEANFLQELRRTFDVDEYPDELFIFHARPKQDWR
ncbi:uncharacterized protein PITG_03839 [Phytophthora infestans T30-4]|uniref:Uncharacterized protein n=1 Tax=Phytophthora infestans (strain T30-4) TaxID=403677 RepID=D0MYN4_PHYIT|nr:uncharacterized protein PITG_03839 [Phytophthora infestans T30-4]EEY66282.1 conserved hypothetical protein [Phytophthora infestans T30-4]|eukprot:XP_002906881.1 conserved hypothetical protein [Phytophthora infestans T30-4]